jgi:hypothetical protein
MDDLKEARRYWKLKEEAQDRTLWRTQFGRGYGPVTRQIITTTTLCLAPSLHPVKGSQPLKIFIIR